MIEDYSVDIYSSLHTVSKAWDEAAIDSLLLNTSQVDVTDPLGRTPLWYASSHGHTSIAGMLIKRGADVNFCTDDGVSCILAAVTGEHISVVLLLLDNHADVNKVADDGRTSLKIAIEIGSTVLVDLLLEHDARIIGAYNEQDYSPLYWSACRGQTDIVNWLLDNGADVNECDEQGRSCLLAATYAGHTDTVMALLRRGANVNQTRDDGKSPLIVATRENHVDIVKILLNYGAQIDAKDSTGWTALYMASRKGHCQLIGLLTAAGADANASSNTGQTCLMAVVYNEHPDVVEELIQRQANVNKQRHDGATALHISCELGHTDIVAILIDGGARLDMRDSKGWMSMQWASYVGKLDIIRKLISGELHNISRTIILLQQRVVFQGVSATALEIACSYGHMDIVAFIQEVLVKLQGEIQNNQSSETAIRFDDGTGNYCNTPLHLCCNVQQAISLLESGADVEAENIDGLRPIHFAVRTGLVELVDLLISHGANVNTTDIHGNSPLHEAVYSNLHVVELLVRNGARTSVRNNDGKMPYHVAAYLHKTDILHVLQNHHKPAELWDISPLDESRHSELHRLVAADTGLNYRFRMSKSVEEAVDTLQEMTDIDKQNHCGHTPLHVARGQRAIKALLKCGNADSLMTKDTTGRNYFHLICTGRYLRSNIELKAIMKSAEEMRMKVNIGLDATDNFGRTPLHYAAMTHASVPYLDYILSVVPDSIRRQDVFGRTPVHYELSTGASEILNRSSSDDRTIVDEFNMTDRDYGNCRHVYRIWEIFDDIYPGKDFTLISPEFVEENLRCCTSENWSSLRNVIRSIRGLKDPSTYINSILSVCQFEYVNHRDGKTATFSGITSVVNGAVHSLADEISKIDDRLTCSVVAVGSAFEGTKVGFCDEFDYMFVLNKLSEEARITISPELPSGFVQLELLDSKAGIWKELLTIDGLVNTQAVKILFETTVEQILADYPFQKQNDIQILNPVRYFDHINGRISKKSNMKLELRLSTPVNGVHVLHDISIDIVPAIRVESLPAGIRQSVAECLQAAQCHMVLVQPHWTYPWMPWSQTSAMISFTRAESLLVRDSLPVVRNAYMIVKHMAKYFSNDIWFSSHVVKTAVLLIMEEEGLTTNSSAPAAKDRIIQLKRESVTSDGVCSEELRKWVRKVTGRLLRFAVQDFAPSFPIRSFHLPVWHNFEPYPMFSRMCLQRHRLSYNDLMADGFCSDIKNGRVGDFQLVNIQRAFVCSHLMHWSVLSDNEELRLHLPHSADC